MTYTRKNKGTCSDKTTVTINDEGILEKIEIRGGCSGNIQGVIRLCEGRPAREVAKTLEGIRCGLKPTSCPDQLAKAINEALEQT